MIASWWLVLLPLVACLAFFVAYYLFYAVMYFLLPERVSAPAVPNRRFVVVIPAHNEEALIHRTLQHALAIDYPADRFRVAVVADNCTDRTALIARRSPVLVLERHDTERRGKGYALTWATHHLPLADYDAVVIIDADTIIHPGFLRQMNTALCAGARVIQAYNDLLNPHDTCLTRLMHVTSVLKNRLFNEARARLGLSVSLMGTGMCFDRALLQETGWKAHSIGEDWEFSARLIQSRQPVAFAVRAVTYSQEATTFRQGFSQRLRWSGGKFAVIAAYTIPLLLDCLRRRDFRGLDSLLALLAPPFSQVAYLSVLLFGLSWLLPMPGPVLNLRLTMAVLLVLQATYLALGLIEMKAPFKTSVAIFLSPFYLSWKAAVDVIAVTGFRRTAWVRTRRHPSEFRSTLDPRD